MPGRPRKPTNLHILDGTLRGYHKDREGEPEYDTDIPGCPPQLSPQAKSEWRRIVPELEAMGLIAKVNRASLAAYCSLYARWVKAERELNKDGEIIKVADYQKGEDHYPRDKSGNIIYFTYKKNPWLNVWLQCAAELRHYANEFGLSPASASKVSAKPKEKAAPVKAKDKNRFFKS